MDYNIFFTVKYTKIYKNVLTHTNVWYILKAHTKVIFK